MDKIKLPKVLKRSFNIDNSNVDEEKRTLKFPFSSELPVDRWFGKEILSHKAGAMRMDRLNDAAPLLYNHDSDQYIGVIESAEVRDSKGYCEVRFSDHAFADQIFRDIKNGILKNVSFGYRIHEMILSKKGADGEANEYTATDFEPYEISVVTIPADNSVGIGRAMPGEDEVELSIKGLDVVSESEIKPAAETAKKGQKMSENNTPDIKVVQNEAAKAERERIASINALGEKFKQPELARQLIDSGKTIDEARLAVLEKLDLVKPIKEGHSHLDLTDKEKRSYSLIRAINAQISGNWKDAGFERELSDAIGKQLGKDTAGFFMPLNVTADRAAYNVATGSQGGNLVATDYKSDMFIDMLRNNMLMMSLGAKVLSGLVGNIAIPKQLTSASAYWVAEGVDITESEGTFGQVSMTPKTVGARSQMTRQMLLQSSPDIEMLVRSDLAQVIALALDAAAINGSGSSGQPRGILNQSGIGSVVMGTNGAALADIDPFIDLETAVADANADFGQLAYVTNAKVVGKLKKLKSSTGEYLWNGYEAGVKANVPGEINGYRVGRTTQVPKTLVKGASGAVCSAAIFGNFSDLIIGQWGPGIEILANPFGAGFNSGSLDIRALSSVDVAVRNAVSFAAITDILAG